MTAAPRRAGAAVSVAAASLLLAGCLPPVGGGDTPPTPRAGQCYDTPDAVLPDAHDPSRPVDCSRPHTLETYAVLRAGRPLDGRTTARMQERCVQRVRAFLGGGDFRQTAVSIYYFTPSRAEQKAGARWVRCDVGVVTDTGLTGARTVTGSLRGAFAGGVPLRYRRCLDQPPDPASKQPLVPCTRPHGAQQMPAGVGLGVPGGRYPGTASLAARAQPRCAALVAHAVPRAARSLVVVPTASMWRSGVTTAQCWALAPPGDRLGGSEAQPA